MKLLTAERAIVAPGDLVIRQSWLRPLLGSAAALGLVTALATLVLRHRLPLPLAAMMSLPALVLGIMAAGAARAAFFSRGWILVIGPDRVFARLRVTGMGGVPGDDVLEMRRSEIHLVRSWSITTRAPQADVYTIERYLDIEFQPAVDTTLLAERLAASLRRPLTTGVSSSTHPVSLLAGDTLRVQWRTSTVQLTPNVDRALSAFGTLAADPVSQCIAFDSRTGDDPEALDRLRALVLEGNDMLARRIALRSLRWSSDRTRQFMRDTRGSATMFD